MRSIVYKYGLLDPTFNVDLVERQISLAHRYRNQLTEIERERRAAVRQILSSHPDTEALSEEVEALANDVEQKRTLIKSQRKAARKRVDLPELRKETKQIAAKLKEMRAQLRAIKIRIKEDRAIQAAILEVDNRAHDRRLKTRHAISGEGLRHGTYTLVEDSAGQAAKTTKKGDPSFVRWAAGEGSVSEQIQGGLSIEETMGFNRRTWIEKQPNSYRGKRVGGESRRSGQAATLHLRIGSADDRGPIWATWPMILQRPLPAGARVQRVTVTRRSTGRTCGRRWIWSCQITLSVPEPNWAEKKTAVAIDVGWRAFGEELRVATALGTDGRHHELRTSPNLRNLLDRVKKKRSLRDEKLDVMRPKLAGWLKEHADILPKWLAEAAAHLSLWKSDGRFRRLAVRWRDHRFDGDGDGFKLLWDWRYTDEHLRDYQVGENRAAHGGRKEQYRLWAKAMTERYDVIILEKFDLRKMARKGPAEAEADKVPGARRTRTQAAVSELRNALLSATGRRGKWLVEVSAVNSTRECHVCGVIETFDAATYVTHCCQNGHQWDQDRNAAAVLLARYLERPDDASIKVGARPKDSEPVESRWVRARRLAEVKAETARKLADNTLKSPVS